MNASLLVTGASGRVGRRVLEILLARAAGPIIATTRKPESLSAFAARGVDVRRADFSDDPSTLAAAFKGAERALLISTDDLRPGRRLAQHEAAVRAFEAAGVRHVVYTSLVDASSSSVLFAPDHAGTEAALAKTGLDFTILQNNVYADMLFVWLPPALASGKLVDARGDGRIAWVAREDCAQVAAAALAGSTTGRHVQQVTGPAALTSSDLASLADDVFSRRIEHVSVSVPVLVREMIDHGTPRPVAEIFGSIDASASNGELAKVSDTVQRLLGRPPQSLRDFLSANRATFGAAAQSRAASART